MIETIDYGRKVICDSCNVDYTDSKATGGLLHQSKAICPVCAPRWRDEPDLEYIRGECPKDMPFADWVRDILRGGQPAQMIILTGEAAEISLGLKLKRDEEPPFPTAA